MLYLTIMMIKKIIREPEQFYVKLRGGHMRKKILKNPDQGYLSILHAKY